MPNTLLPGVPVIVKGWERDAANDQELQASERAPNAEPNEWQKWLQIRAEIEGRDHHD